ncbi:copper resistance protein NlpE N-terminal domain-containing protein [Bacteroidales bacterium OttesenSCG-928-M11]|nr:copper resistance protein NlpE N-terminal domain-containing protein [Bacteroidales bacterium OttesenSCG-928-M11]
MKKLFLFMSILALLVGCKSTSNEKESVVKTVDNPRTSLDWSGAYAGTLPCADCAGIDFSLILSSDNTYALSRTYLKNPEQSIKSEGSFEWDNSDSKITLKGMDEKEGSFIFKIGENKLVYLDQQGKEITGELADRYILTKLDDAILNKYWKLVELMGNPVNTPEGAKEPFMTLKTDGRVHGNFGCNTFNGSYALRIGNRISFSQMASTMMMCLNMETESKFSEVLSIADNYSIDGDNLTLNRARMAPLARFVAVEQE